jgi:glycerol-3-phosphate acyltransferase PlsY
LVGVILALYSPYIILIVLGWFALVFIITRYVSLSSITASLLFAILAIFVFHEQNTYLIILAALIAIFIPLTHHKNIRRLLKGEESKLSFRKKQKPAE